MKPIAAIYMILCTMNGLRYIGSTKDIQRRRRDHNKRLRSNAHENRRLQEHWNLYGGSNFHFLLLEKCKPEKLIQREQHYMDELKPEYNIYKNHPRS